MNADEVINGFKPFVHSKGKSIEALSPSDATKLIWAETPTNPLMSIVDIKAMVSIARDNDLLLCVDNTF